VDCGDAGVIPFPHQLYLLIHGRLGVFAPCALLCVTTMEGGGSAGTPPVEDPDVPATPPAEDGVVAGTEDDPANRTQVIPPMTPQDTTPMQNDATQMLPAVTIDAEEMVRAVIDEINVFRRNPRKYAQQMKKLTKCYQDKMLTYPESGVEFETIEGADALEDCLQDLLNASPLPTMTVSQALSQACGQHLQDLMANDFCSHIGTDGSTPEERLTRFGEHREQCGENVVFSMRTARETVYHMLIDDGSPERGHRANLLNMDFHFVGAAHGGHPSAETATVVLLVDHFHVKQVSVLDRMRNVTEAVIGREVPARAEHRNKTTQKGWDRLMQDMKPDHLAVPGRLLDHVHRNVAPGLYREKILPIPSYPIGELSLKPGVDPAIVRAFVHRIDRNHDDGIVEAELKEIIHHHQLNVTVTDLKDLFDEIVMLRPWHDRNRRSVDWQEIFLAMKAHKRWVPAMDLHVERDGDRYQLTVSVDEMNAWCTSAHEELFPLTDNLPQAPSFDSSSKDGPRNRSGARRIQELNIFLESMITACDQSSGEPLQYLPTVQQMLGHPGGGRPAEITSVTCMGQRRLWAHAPRPFRQLWVLLHQTIGLNALVPIPIHKAPSAAASKTIHKHITEKIADLDRRNVAKVPEPYTGVPAAAAKMKTTEIPQRVQVRAPGSADATKTMRTTVDSIDEGQPPQSRQKQTPAPVHPWEDQRQQTESTVNKCLKPGGTGAASMTAGSDAFSAPAAQMAYTFEARRRFKQMHAKQEMASEEQRNMGMDRTAARSMGSASTGRLATTGVGGYAVAMPTASGLGPAEHAHRSRGSGASSRSAAGGVTGHFHNSLAVHQKDGSHGFPQSLPASWDGSHIDHTRAAPQKDVGNFGQPAGYSYMTKEERGKQFSTYFKHKNLGSGTTDGTHDNFAAKAKAAASMISDKDPHVDWKRPEFREDNARRLGKFGRRDFDPQVRELPAKNPNSVSQIEDKPMEEYFRQQERVDDFLNRAVPPGQQRHFEQYQPRCNNPRKHEEMSSRVPQHNHMDGDQKLPSMGFGQNRHSDHARDYRLYTRPLGTSHLDRVLPIA